MKKKLNILPDNPEDNLGRFPSFLHRKLPKGNELFETGDLVKKYRLNTVCEEAKCPNRMECYSKKTATFLALGSACTRACGFCEIDFSKNPLPPEEDEPERIAQMTKELGLKHVVITMVARDDLYDGGGVQIARIIRTVRKTNPGITVEVLTSDFNGNIGALDLVLLEEPEIFNYNIETVKRLTPKVRHTATYERTLSILEYASHKGRNQFVKSGLMLGLGETQDEVHEAIRDLHNAGVEIITMGHYLQPSKRKLSVKQFITPEQFKAYEEYGLSIGVPHMYCGPFVRSSYNADLFVKKYAEHTNT
ncbi:MAG: lipoyl synthase [Chlamydiales bacterium]